jgi:hypothetical protein
MVDFIKRHAANIRSVLLILMLLVPFLLYYFARSGSTLGVVFFLAVMGAVMVVAMKA